MTGRLVIVKQFFDVGTGSAGWTAFPAAEAIG